MRQTGAPICSVPSRALSSVLNSSTSSDSVLLTLSGEKSMRLAFTFTACVCVCV